MALSAPLIVLIAEDNPADAELMALQLRQSGLEITWKRVDTETSFREALREKIDLVLSDYSMPGFTGTRALELLKQSGQEVPFILVSGVVGEDIAVAAMRSGAADYLLKDRILRLGAAVVHALDEFKSRREQRRFQAEAQRQQAELRVLFDLMPAMIWFKDTDNRLLRVNERVAHFAGRSVAEIEGKSCCEIYPYEPLGYYADEIEIMHSGVSKLGVIETLTDFKGRKLIVQTDKVPVRDETKVIGIVVTALDITERRRADEALQASERKFKALFDQATVGVAWIDVKTGRFGQTNQRLGEILSLTKEELEHTTFIGVAHPSDCERSFETMRMLIDGSKREIAQERRFLRKDGSEVWAHVTLSAMWEKGETPTQLIAVVVDLTAQKRMEERTREAQKMEAIGTLAGGIAHDFNNVLACINGYTALIRMDLGPKSQMNEYLDAVLQGTTRAANLVQQILAFSRQQELERKPLGLPKSIAEALKLLRAAIPSNIEFKVCLEPNVANVLADETQVQQVLINLCTNAAHAMKDRAGLLKITLDSFVVDGQMASHWTDLHVGPYVRLSVSDNGRGIPAALLSRIFDPFFTTKIHGEGTGLGLAVVRGIMQSHDGAVSVYSHAGEGTVFNLFFPPCAHETQEDEREVSALPIGKGEKILYVDDESVLADMGKKILERLGYSVTTPSSAIEALALVEACPQAYDLVITDQMMPGMTGTNLAAHLHIIRTDLPVILTTGYSASLTADGFQPMGITKLLMKPVSVEALASAVASTLAAAKAT